MLTDFDDEVVPVTLHVNCIRTSFVDLDMSPDYKTMNKQTAAVASKGSDEMVRRTDTNFPVIWKQTAKDSKECEIAVAWPCQP